MLIQDGNHGIRNWKSEIVLFSLKLKEIESLIGFEYQQENTNLNTNLQHLIKTFKKHFNNLLFYFLITLLFVLFV